VRGQEHRHRGPMAETNYERLPASCSGAAGSSGWTSRGGGARPRSRSCGKPRRRLPIVVGRERRFRLSFGFVQNLARPGGNIHRGVERQRRVSYKYVEILREAIRFIDGRGADEPGPSRAILATCRGIQSDRSGYREGPCPSRPRPHASIEAAFRRDQAGATWRL
jgi:hypothetical protein